MYRWPALERRRGAVALCLAMVALHQLAGAAQIQLKAWLAPVLIERAWEATLDKGTPVKPWPWADTWPVARLTVPNLERELFVLAGDSGNALAFGPGHSSASAALGSSGLSVIGGHRDTHFAFLRELQPAEPLHLQLPDGRRRHYRVVALRIANAERERLHATGGAERLLLVTCYPFDTIRPGGPLRYVVEAHPADGKSVWSGTGSAYKPAPLLL